MAFEVYCITNQANGKRYVGVTTTGYENRFANHLWHSKKSKSSCRALHSAMRKYGAECFSVELLEFARDWRHMNQLEREWIKKLDTLAPAGYNLTDGGDAGTFSDETRQMMSDRLRGRPVSQKTVEGQRKAWDDPVKRERRVRAIREAMNRPEVREATGARQRGKPKSENHIRALRQSRARAVVCVENGEKVDAFIDAVNWARETQDRPTANHSKILRAMKDEKFTAYGYRWKYANA